MANETFGLLAEFAVATGAKSIGDLAGCWEKRIDEHWWVAVNGHLDEVACSREAPVPPRHAYIEYDGWPAGVLSEQGGVVTMGEVANEDSLKAALRRAVTSLQGRRG